MSDALMWPPIVVVFDVLSDAEPEFAHSVHGVDVDIFCLDGSPKSLYPDVVLAVLTLSFLPGDTNRRRASVSPRLLMPALQNPVSSQVHRSCVGGGRARPVPLSLCAECCRRTLLLRWPQIPISNGLSEPKKPHTCWPIRPMLTAPSKPQSLHEP